MQRSSLLVVSLLLGGEAVAAERVVDRVAAVVNDDVIALSEVYEIGSDEITKRCPFQGEACLADAEGQVLEALIDRALQRQELQRLGMDVTAEEVNAAIDDVVLTYDFPDRDALRQEVEGRGFTWDTYRAQQIEGPLRERKFVEVVLRNRVTITPDEIQDAYQRLVRSLVPPPIARIHAAGRRVDAQGGPDALPLLLAEARALVEAVRAGTTTWDEASQTWDTARVGPAFAGVRFERGDLADALAIAAFDNAPGTVVDPIIVSGIVMLVQVVEHGEGKLDVRSFEDAKDELTEQVFMTKVTQAADDWVVTTRRRAAIRTFVGPKPAAAETPSSEAP